MKGPRQPARNRKWGEAQPADEENTRGVQDMRVYFISHETTTQSDWFVQKKFFCNYSSNPQMYVCYKNLIKKWDYGRKSLKYMFSSHETLIDKNF